VYATLVNSLAVGWKVRAQTCHCTGETSLLGKLWGATAKHIPSLPVQLLSIMNISCMYVRDFMHMHDVLFVPAWLLVDTVTISCSGWHVAFLTSH